MQPATPPESLLAAFFRADRPLHLLAEAHGLSPAQLLAWIESEPIQAQIAALRRLAAIQREILADLAAPEALAALRQQLAPSTPGESPVPSDDRTRRIRLRERESTGRAAVGLLRAVHRVTPPRETPGLRPRSAPTPGARAPGSDSGPPHRDPADSFLPAHPAGPGAAPPPSRPPAHPQPAPPAPPR